MNVFLKSSHRIANLGSDMAAETGRIVLVKHLSLPKTPTDGIYLLFEATHHPYEIRWAKKPDTIVVVRAHTASGGLPPKEEGFIGACTGPGKWIALVDALFVYNWPASGEEYERMLMASKGAGTFRRDQGGFGAAVKTGGIHQRWTVDALKQDKDGKLLGALVRLSESQDSHQRTQDCPQADHQDHQDA